MLFAVQKISEFIVDVDEGWKRLIRKNRIWNWVVHIVQNRLVVDERWWDGLAMKGRWTNDNGQEYYTERAEVTDDEGKQ